MFCTKCGCECDDNQQFCTNCGAELSGTEPHRYAENVGSVSQRFVDAYSDPLFLTGCVLITVSAISFNIINILLAVFMWRVYTMAKKGFNDVSYMCKISGTVFAITVFIWIIVAMLGLLSLFVLFVGTVSLTLDFEEFGLLFSELKRTGVVGLFLEILLTTVVLIVFNLLAYKPMHKLAKSMYRSVQTGSMRLERVEYVRIWMFITGIINGILAILNISIFTTFVQLGCVAAAMIVLSVWLKKNFESSF